MNQDQDKKLVFPDDVSQQAVDYEELEIPGVADKESLQEKPQVAASGVNLKHKLQRVGYIFFFLVLLGFMGWNILSDKIDKRRAYEEAQQNVETGKTVEQKLPTLRMPERTPPTITPTMAISEELPAPRPTYIGRDPMRGEEELSPEEQIELRKKIAPVTFAFSGDQLGDPLEGERGQWAASSGSDNLSQALTSAVTVRANASHLGNRNFIISKGTMIEGVLTTAVSSDVMGMIKATVTQDVYSANGKVCLLERGTHLIGEYQTGLSNGQSRLFVIWSRAETPTGVVINLDSPAADDLGRSGLDGHVNTHFWKRFGYALAISTWSDLMQIAIDSQRDFKGDDNYITYDNTVRAAQDMATETLRHQINIPPTLEKNQGEPVRVFVARDLDFSKVYRLALK